MKTQYYGMIEKIYDEPNRRLLNKIRRQLKKNIEEAVNKAGMKCIPGTWEFITTEYEGGDVFTTVALKVKATGKED